MSVNLTDAYQQVLSMDSDIHDHLPTFHDLVIDLDAQKVAELGVRSGVSTVAWLHALGQTGGHLYGVDLEPAPFEHERLTFLRGDDCSPEVYEVVPDDLDICFVDSSHHYVQTVAEIGLYAPKLAPGGCMVFHDVDVERFDHHPDDEPPFPVRKAVEEAAHEMGWEVDWRTGSHGLAIAWPTP